MLLCDAEGCYENYYMQCLDPPLEHIPEGDWICPLYVYFAYMVTPEDCVGGVAPVQTAA